MKRYEQLIKAKCQNEWDVVVIGGGATGLGVAVDAASRGFSTLLVERADFSKGTSSKSTKLVVGTTDTLVREVEYDPRPLDEEIDFIARKTDETIYIQVAYEISENTHETDNLLHIKDNYKKILITGRYYDQSEIDGIDVIYIVDWLLG